MIADDPFKKRVGMVDMYFEEKEEKDPKLAIELVIRETKYQINKCKFLIAECERSPRYKFILDFDEAYWLYD